MAYRAGTRTRTVRLSAEQADALDAMALVDGISTNEELRRAISRHIDARRDDTEFQRRLRASIDRSRSIMERLLR